MAKTYAKGTRAWGICQRSGKRMLLKDLVEDGRVPGLLVAPDWFEPFQPQEKPIDVSDAMALRKPSPETSIESNYKVPAPALDTYIPK